MQRVYESILSSLDKWFSADPLSPVNLSLWSIAMSVSLMRNIDADFEARSIYIHLAAQDVKDLFARATPDQLHILVHRLMESSAKRQDVAA